jgi:rod shape-determining protein MreC
MQLNEENYNLVQENKELRNLLKQNYKTSLTEFISIDDSVSIKWYNYDDVKIISNSTNKQHNYITLNKGSEQGIKTEMGVISSNGVIGKVHSVSKNFAVVISILNSDFRLSAKIKRNNYFGSLTWDGVDYQFALLNDIPYHVELNKGDSIITSGLTTLFPEGIPVGTIEDFEVKDGNFYTIKVRLSNDFKQISDVYVIDNNFKEEQEELQNSILTND